MEVLFGLVSKLRVSEDELLKCSEEKNKRGGFEVGAVLLDVYEE